MATNFYHPNKEKSWWTGIKFYGQLLKLSKWFLLVFVIIGIAYSSLNLAAVFFMRLFLKAIVEQKNYQQLWLVILLILLLTGGLQYGINFLVIRCNQKAGYRLRTHLYAKLLRIRVHYYDQSATGDILARSDNDLITTINGFTLFFNQLVLNIFTMVILIVTMFLVSFYLALVVSIITPITLFISLLFLFQLKKYIKQRQHNLSILNGFLEETISGLKEIKIFHQETSFETTFIQLNQKYVRSAYQADFWFAFFIPFNTFFNNLINIIIVALGIVIITGIGHNNGNFLGIFSTNLFSQYQKNGNNFSNDTYWQEGVLVLNTFIILSKNLNNRLYQILSIFNEVQSAVHTANRVQTIMHLPEEFNPEEQINFRIIPPNQKPYWLMNPCYPLPKAVTKKNLSFSKPLTIHPPANQNYHTCFHHGSIVVKDLSFSYDENKPVLTNISFQVHPGQFVGIVGPTGSGKSTFINLLTKFYDLQTGEIFFNGISIKKITKESLRKNIALVLQDNILFETTFFQNIAYGNLNASYDDVVLAAKLTGLSELIAKQNNQYATIINRSQNNLSEGEKQLIAITRALLSDAPILIFDEATALVDLKTEYQIKQAMKKLLKTKTAFVIAHRLSTIRDADLILVFNQGKLIEQGTHLQLMAQKSFYYHLYHAQP